MLLQNFEYIQRIVKYAKLYPVLEFTGSNVCLNSHILILQNIKMKGNEEVKRKQNISFYLALVYKHWQFVYKFEIKIFL